MKKTNPNLSSKNNFDQEKYLYLTTRGRKSGQPREIEIWFTHYQGRFYVIAEYPTSNWVKNLQSNSAVQVRVSGQNFSTHSRVLNAETDATLRATIQELSSQKYGWGDGLVIELAPDN